MKVNYFHVWPAEIWILTRRYLNQERMHKKGLMNLSRSLLIQVYGSICPIGATTSRKAFFHRTVLFLDTANTLNILQYEASNVQCWWFFPFCLPLHSGKNLYSQISYCISFQTHSLKQHSTSLIAHSRKNTFLSPDEVTESVQHRSTKTHNCHLENQIECEFPFVAD